MTCITSEKYEMKLWHATFSKFLPLHPVVLCLKPKTITGNPNEVDIPDAFVLIHVGVLCSEILCFVSASRN